MIPGWVSSISGSARGTSGPTSTSPTELIVPTSTPLTAPVVLNRRQVNASSSAGKFALAATAKASPTMYETFRSAPPMIAIAIEITPIESAAMRATLTSSFSESRPFG